MKIKINSSIDFDIFHFLPSISYAKFCNCINIDWLCFHIWIDWWKTYTKKYKSKF